MQIRKITTVVAVCLGLWACGGDGPDRAARDAEIQQKIQEGLQREKQLYEGMQKGVQDVEKQMQEQSGKSRK